MTDTPVELPYSGNPERNLFSIEPESISGVIIVRARGFWTLHDVTAYFDAFGRVVARFRDKGIPLSVYFDLSSSPVQSPEIATTMREHNQAIYRAGDRRGIVSPSNLLRMQLRRSYGAERVETFESEAEALRWLRSEV